MVYKLFKRYAPAKLIKQNVKFNGMTFMFHIAYHYDVFVSYRYTTSSLTVAFYYNSWHIASCYINERGCMVYASCGDRPPIACVTNIREITETAKLWYREQLRGCDEIFKRFLEDDQRREFETLQS